jgi:DNA-binding response OmpR family regulator
MGQIDLVITEVVLPGMNGLELGRELGKMHASLKILYVSDRVDGVLGDRGALGCRIEFLQKPLRNEVLALRVRELLDGNAK